MSENELITILRTQYENDIRKAERRGRVEVANAVRAVIGYANGPEAVEHEDRVIAALDGATS